jgi:hypothetical protein
VAALISIVSSYVIKDDKQKEKQKHFSVLRGANRAYILLGMYCRLALEETDSSPREEELYITEFAFGKPNNCVYYLSYIFLRIAIKIIMYLFKTRFVKFWIKFN